MLTSTYSLAPNNRSSLSAASDSSHSHKPLSRSSVASKSTQNQDLQQQIALLKQKAHQSFMQVIQIQQLHEEQLEQLRNEFSLKESTYQSQIKALRSKVKQLETENLTLDKNYRHHSYGIEEELDLDSIEPISCRDESKLDDSSINNIIEIVSFQAAHEKLNAVRHDMKSQIAAIATEHQEQIQKVQAMTDKVFEYVLHLSREFTNLQDNYNQLKRLSDENEDMSNNCKKFTQSLQKENKFMGENIKRLSGEKMKAEKRAVEAQRKIKALEEKVKKMQELLNRKGMKSQELVMKKSIIDEDHDHSLDINEFIQQNLNLAKSQQIPKSRLAFATHPKR